MLCCATYVWRECPCGKLCLDRVPGMACMVRRQHCLGVSDMPVACRDLRLHRHPLEWLPDWRQALPAAPRCIRSTPVSACPVLSPRASGEHRLRIAGAPHGLPAETKHGLFGGDAGTHAGDMDLTARCSAYLDETQSIAAFSVGNRVPYLALAKVHSGANAVPRIRYRNVAT
jgi:hypothetical protein